MKTLFALVLFSVSHHALAQETQPTGMQEFNQAEQKMRTATGNVGGMKAFISEQENGKRVRKLFGTDWQMGFGSGPGEGLSLQSGFAIAPLEWLAFRAVYEFRSNFAQRTGSVVMLETELLPLSVDLFGRTRALRLGLFGGAGTWILPNGPNIDFGPMGYGGIRSEQRSHRNDDFRSRVPTKTKREVTTPVTSLFSFRARRWSSAAAQEIL